MSPRTLVLLEKNFLGKVCSIFTGPINREFDEVRSREHFVVRVREINGDGIVGEHPYNGTVSWFAMSHVKLITEEVVLDPNNPEHARMIREYQEKTGETIMSDVSPHLAPVVEPLPQPPPPSQFVDLGQLASLAELAQKSFEPSP